VIRLPIAVAMAPRPRSTWWTPLLARLQADKVGAALRHRDLRSSCRAGDDCQLAEFHLATAAMGQRHGRATPKGCVAAWQSMGCVGASVLFCLH
jgi:hypothetical protein